ncbi:CHY zinc finger protein [Agromyces sp. ZXT2-3]|uniref:CHY zinc finger protein n=1 Tax=Agromyces sp. ZXT2-3 TaxID=3461152 RepID=UPI0040550E51
MSHDEPAARPRVLGAVVDDETRCVHYRTEVDIVAIRFACCGEYYPCHLCHEEAAGHPARQWPVAERGEHAILCGACGDELPIATYLEVDACPGCGAAFNPRCRLHAHLYFETA